MALGAAGTYTGYSFALSGATGVLAGLGAASEIFQFRWTGPNPVRVLAALLSASVDATGFTAGSAKFDLAIARSFSVDGTGGAVTAPVALRSKGQLPTRGGALRSATTAALGAGTKVVDASSVGNIIAPAGAAGSQMLVAAPLFQDLVSVDGQPFTLSNGEGFVVRATVPTTGTFAAALNLLLAEID